MSAKSSGKLAATEHMRAMKAARADELAGQVDPAVEARVRERKLLDGLGVAADDLEWLATNQAWVLLGHDTCAAWWEDRVKPVAESLGFQPTRELGMRFVELIRAEEMTLPPAQRRSTKELALFVGVSEWAARGRKETRQRRSAPHVDLAGRPALEGSWTEEDTTETSGAVPPASTEDASPVLGGPDVDVQAASTSGTQDSPAADSLPPQAHAGVPAVGGQIHEQENGWSGPNGDCGVSCTCGVMFDGFDTIGEARALLDLHIANPEERDEEEAADDFVPVTGETVAGLHRRWLDAGLPAHTWQDWLERWEATYSPAAATTSLPDGDPTPNPLQQPGHNSPTGQGSELPEGSAVVTTGRSETDDDLLRRINEEFADSLDAAVNGHHDGAGVSLSGEALPVESAGALLEDGDAAVTPSSSDYLMHLFASLVHGLSGLDAEALGPQLLGEEMELLHQHVDDITHFVSQLGRARFTEMTRTP